MLGSLGEARKELPGLWVPVVILGSCPTALPGILFCHLGVESATPSLSGLHI